MSEFTIKEIVDHINDSTKDVRTVYFAFLATLLYLAVTIAGTTHRQLLLESPLTLPLINTGVPIVEFYFITPALVLILHLNVLLLHYLLARKLRLLLHTHPTRDNRPPSYLEYLFPSPLILGLHGDHLPKPAQRFLRLTVTVSIILAPLFLLVFAQLRFLPYHDSLTWWHRSMVLLDSIMVLIGWPAITGQTSLLLLPKKNLRSLWTALRRELIRLGGRRNGKRTRKASASNRFTKLLLRRRQRQIRLVLRRLKNDLPALGFCGGIGFASLFIIAYPGERVAYLPDHLHWLNKHLVRNINVANQNLASESPGDALLAASLAKYGDAERGWRASTKGISLQNRDLRFANFYGCRLINANLRNALVEGADFSHAIMPGSEMVHISGKHPSFLLADLRGCSFNGAIIPEADFTGAQLHGATFEGADVEEGTFDACVAPMASFLNLNKSMEYSSLSFAGADLEGARFWDAFLINSDFFGANLTATDFREADVRGVIFQDTTLAWTDFSDASNLWDKVEHQRLNPRTEARLRKTQHPFQADLKEDGTVDLAALSAEMHLNVPVGFSNVNAVAQSEIRHAFPLELLPFSSTTNLGSFFTGQSRQLARIACRDIACARAVGHEGMFYPTTTLGTEEHQRLGKLLEVLFENANQKFAPCNILEGLSTDQRDQLSQYYEQWRREAVGTKH